jgi:hypothetical protein
MSKSPAGRCPLAVISWHLSRRLEDPLLVIAASPRLHSNISPTLEIIIETGFQLLVDALLYVACDHRAWVLERLPAGARARERAEAELGGLLFDVEGQDALAAYLRRLYGARLNVKARAGGAPKQLRLAP